MANWPETLPQALQGDYQEEPPGQVIISPMEVGPPKIRRRSTNPWRPVSAGYQMSGSQLSTFMTFFATDCKQGSLPFEWPHPRLGSSVTAYFVSKPTASNKGHDQYLVRLQLLVDEG